MNIDRGIIYIATRQIYLDEAIRSAASVREYHPDIPITLFISDELDIGEHPFSTIEVVDNPNHNFSDSNLSQRHFLHEKNLFLDSDTYISGSLDPIFDLLDRFEIVAAHDPTRTGTVEHNHEHNVPESFPQFNTGVVGYQDSTAVRRLFNRWNELYHTVDGIFHGLNQPTFRMAAYESDAVIGTLPPEYNFRIGCNANHVNYACGPVVILHGRSVHWDPKDMIEVVNRETEQRVIVSNPWPPTVITESDNHALDKANILVEKAGWKLYKDGFGGLAKAAVNTMVPK